MAMPKSKGKRYSVDLHDYVVAINTEWESGSKTGRGVQLRVTMQAEYGHRSICIVRGLTNFDYYKDYGSEAWEQNKPLSVTPGTVSKLIKYALKSGWNPSGSPSSYELNIDNESLLELGST